MTIATGRDERWNALHLPAPSLSVGDSGTLAPPICELILLSLGITRNHLVKEGNWGGEGVQPLKIPEL